MPGNKLLKKGLTALKSGRGEDRHGVEELGDVCILSAADTHIGHG
jgi:hypothetical protein